MRFDFMTREVFDTLIVAIIIIGSLLAAWRLRADFTRPLRGQKPAWSDEDTQENKIVKDEDEHA
jgi:hypothetical protein